MKNNNIPLVDEWTPEPDDIYFTNRKDIIVAPISNYFRLEDICLSPKYQRNGFGSQFIKLISDCVSSENCDSILLGTQRGYPAHRFYLKNDFQEIDSVLLYREI